MSLQPVLNYDILLEALKLCPSQADCSRFMRTARFFYTHGFAALLSHGVSLDTQEALLVFLASLRRDAGQRYKHVRSLRLTFLDLTGTAALELADALRLMCNLGDLSISHSEDVMLSHHDLLDAFAALKSVRTLSLGYLEENALKMLRSLRSELTSINLDFLSLNRLGESFLETVSEEDLLSYHPAVLLEHSRSSLQKLSSYAWHMDVETLPDPALVYPQMRCLELDRSGFPRTVSLMHAYPHLTCLLYLTRESELGHFSSFDCEIFEARRSLNLTELANSGDTWSALREFRGSIIDLYLLGLTSLIDRADLHGVCDDIAYMFDPVLSCVRPRHLSLDEWPGRIHGPPADVFAALRGQNSSRLETLRILVRLHDDDNKVDIAAVFEGLREALRAAPLQDLQVRIVLSGLDPRPRPESFFVRELRRQNRIPTPPPPNPEDYPLSVAERSAESLDLEGYMRRFMGTVPTLKSAHFVLEGLRDQSREVTLVDGQLRVDVRERRRYGVV